MKRKTLIQKLETSTKVSSIQKLIVYVAIVLILILILYIILNQFKEYFDSRDPLIPIIKSTLLPLHPIVQKVQFFEGNKSYTINKHKIYLCIRDKNHQYYEFNMLMYVSIHELAHVLCDEIGHTPKFDHIFHELLKKAASLGIYNPNQPPLSEYCGHE